MSKQDEFKKLKEYHACFDGSCPHSKWTGCMEQMFYEGYSYAQKEVDELKLKYLEMSEDWINRIKEIERLKAIIRNHGCKHCVNAACDCVVNMESELNKFEEKK